MSDWDRITPSTGIDGMDLEDDVEGHGLREFAVGVAMAGAVAVGGHQMLASAQVSPPMPPAVHAPSPQAPPAPSAGDAIAAVNHAGGSVLPRTWGNDVQPLEQPVLGLAGSAISDISADASAAVNNVVSDVDAAVSSTLGTVKGTADPALAGATGTVNRTVAGVTGGIVNPALAGATGTVNGELRQVATTADSTVNGAIDPLQAGAAYGSTSAQARGGVVSVGAAGRGVSVDANARAQAPSVPAEAASVPAIPTVQIP